MFGGFFLFAFTVDGGCNGVECDAHAQCVQPFDDQPFQCECGEGWQGDGLTCSGNKDISAKFETNR